MTNEISVQRAALKALYGASAPMPTSAIAAAIGNGAKSNDVGKRVAALIRKGHANRHHNDNGILTYSITPAGAKDFETAPGRNLTNAIRDVLDRARDPMSTIAVQEAIGREVTLSKVSGLLYALRHSGEVVKTGPKGDSMWRMRNGADPDHEPAPARSKVTKSMPLPAAKLTPPAPNAVEPNSAPTGPAPVVSESPTPSPSPAAAATPCAAHEAASETSSGEYARLFELVTKETKPMRLQFSGDMTEVPGLADVLEAIVERAIDIDTPKQAVKNLLASALHMRRAATELALIQSRGES